MRGIDISVLLISASFGCFLAFYTAINRRAPGSKALSVLILGASFWAMGYAFELLASSLTFKLIWEKFEFFGIVTIPIAWFIFVAQYLGYPRWMKAILKYKLLLGIIPLVTLILVWTNDLHNLVWHKVELEHIGPLIALDYVRGPWFWVAMAFSYLLLILGAVELVVSISKIVSLHRWQVYLTILAILLPWVGNILYITGRSPEHFLDWTAFLFLISGILLSISLFRYQLANILPIAQETVFAGLSDGVIVLDMNDLIVDLNPSAKMLINRPGEDALGKNIRQVMPWLSDYITLAADAKEYKTEITQGDGQDRQCFDLHVSILIDPYTNPIGRVVVLHKITQLKQYQAELEQARDHLEAIVLERTEALRRAIGQLNQELEQRTLAEKRFEDVIESAPDAMFVLDQTGKVLLVNAMAEQLFGYLRNELIGGNIEASLIPAKKQDVRNESLLNFINHLPDNQSMIGEDFLGVNKDGSEFPTEVALRRLKSTSGFWVAINVHDISERQRVENALRESEQTYRALFENAGDAIFITDLSGKILRANRKASEFLELNQDELQALTIHDITVPGEMQNVQQNMDNLIEGSRLTPYVRHYLKKTGEPLPAENNTVLVCAADGTPMFFQNIARDISERLKSERAQNQLLEEIRESNEKMRSLALRLQEVQELERQELASLLHDQVGQNLTGLNLNLKILQNQLQSEFDSEIVKRLNDSLIMVEETTRMIRGVMADLNPPILVEYGLVPAIKWYCGDFSNRTGIATQVSGDKFEPRLAPTVEKIVFRLIQESLNNVAKHAKASRAIVIIKSSKEGISVTIKDNGSGFDPDEVKQPTTAPHWGLLSMQQRAASIGAALAIDSTPGNGTQVCVMIRRNHHGD